MNLKLPRGVRLDHGYVQVRIWAHGQYVFCKNFGPVCDEALDAAAEAYLSEKKRIKAGEWGVKKDPRKIKFKEAREIYLKRHYIDYKDPNTGKPRSAHSIGSVRGYLNMLGTEFDDTWLHEITIKDIKAFKDDCIEERGQAAATFNKQRMLLRSLFEQFRGWGNELQADAVLLPKDSEGRAYNPCDFVGILTENRRTRVPTVEELRKAHLWCVQNDQELWYAIEMALLTALRKSDLVGLTGEVKGVQKKTGGAFALPMALEKEVRYNRNAWNRLREHMGWNPGLPLHTTWHDLRHWAPTLLGIGGFTGKQIQAYTSHKSEDALARYINVKAEHVPAMLERVQAVLAEVKQ